MGDLVTVQVRGNVGTIEDNLDEVEASIRGKVAGYSAVAITEETVKDGKRMLADIRREKQALDSERKSIKKAWMAPYEAFEERVKKIIGLYDEPVGAINRQIGEFEKRRREEKRRMVQDIYDSTKGDMGGWLPLEKIYNPKWENATYSKKQIRGDMELLFGKVKVSISAIRSAGSEFMEEGLAVLKGTGDLAAAFEEMDRRKRMKEEILAKEERRRAEEEKKTEGAQAAIKDATPEGDGAQKKGKQEDIPQAVGGKADTPQEKGGTPPFERDREVTVQVHIGESRLAWLERVLEENFIRYEVV